MFWNILKFELQYRAKRPATYIYFGIMFFLSFAAIAIENLTVGGGTGQVKENAPVVITTMMLILSAIIGIFIISAIMGVPVLRDFDHKTESMMFTTPIKKGAYLFGRFSGSFLVLFFVFSGILLGLTTGSLMPWLDEEKLLPFNFYHFWQPFWVLVVPNLFFAGAIFFAGGTLSRNILVVYVQSIALLVLYLIAGDLISEMDNKTLGALIDPFAISTTRLFTQYWTVAEQNTQVVPLEGVVLANRLIWIGVGALVLVLTYVGFSYNVIRKPWFQRRRKEKPVQGFEPTAINLPAVRQQFGFSTQVKQTLSLSTLYFREIVKSLPFIAITLMGMALLLINGRYINQMYGTTSYPITYSMVELISEFNLFFLIIIVFYSGELIWKERDIRMNQIFDSLPVPNFAGLLSKFLGMVYVHLSLLVILIVTGVLIQTAKGYYNYELGVYVENLFGETLPFLILFTLLAFFVQVMANHKFLGHALMVLFFISTVVMNELGLEHKMFRFGSGGLGEFSDMNQFGHFVLPFSWYQFYWFAFAAVLFALSVVFSLRGTDALLRTRLKLARMRFARPILVFTLAGLILFVSSGFYIFYNTNILNEYENSKEQEQTQADYEKQLKQYEHILKPKIVDTYVEVDIFPEKRDFSAEGYYVLKNKGKAPIEEIHIQHNPDQDLSCAYLRFSFLDSLGGGEVSLEEDFEEFGYEIWSLSRPLMPGDSLKMEFKVDFVTEGFREGRSNTEIVFNGTFFNNNYFPGLGYNRAFELEEDDERKEYGLPERERLPERTDSVAISSSLFGDEADHIRFEAVLSTSPDQIAIAPGYLQREWEEGGRRYFHYKMDIPMANFYSLVSARYEVMRDSWTSPGGEKVNLEIYYHPGHEYNLDRLMKGMKHSLAYYSKHFSPFQYRQLRIMEFPRYRTFAQSFANTVPFSEGIGFVLQIDEENSEDVDMAYYVTAHEVAHQWWGHQVMEARTKGNAMLSETLSQYSALMVMKQEYSPEMMQKFLKYELDRYLSGRAAETKKEQPLALVEGQGYIHYRKGSVIMYALQDYIGEDSINAALRRWVQDWAWREDRYPTSDLLLEYFREVTPDSLQYLITDMFETITLFENRVKEPTFVEEGENSYLVSIPTVAVKYRADSLGNETEIPIADWMDIGVYGQTPDGRDTLLYLEKHRVDQKEQVFEVRVKQLPTKAGIDPIHKLIDRNPDDNIAAVEQEKKSGSR